MLDPLSQRLEGFAEADLHRFNIGVGQHQVEDEMREGVTLNVDPQILHVGEI
jgi:hypothetical protein